MLRDSIFISYSHKDVKWLQEVRKHLSILEHNYHLLIWDDTRIQTGSDWKIEIDQSIKRCRVAVLLVSSNFLSSEFILKKEVPHILNAARRENVKIFNVIVDTCTFLLTDLSKFQCLNDPKFPLEDLKPSARKRVLVALTSELLEAVGTRQPDSPGLPVQSSTDITRMLTLVCLVKRGPLTITEIQNYLTLQRKSVVESLESLERQAYVERSRVVISKGHSTKWHALELGTSSIKLFESVYLRLANSIK